MTKYFFSSLFLVLGFTFEEIKCKIDHATLKIGGGGSMLSTGAGSKRVIHCSYRSP